MSSYDINLVNASSTTYYNTTQQYIDYVDNILRDIIENTSSSHTIYISILPSSSFPSGVIGSANWDTNAIELSAAFLRDTSYLNDEQIPRLQNTLVHEVIHLLLEGIGMTLIFLSIFLSKYFIKVVLAKFVGNTIVSATLNSEFKRNFDNESIN